MDDVSYFFSNDENEMVEMKWDALPFIDAMKMADKAWSMGANFDVDKNILSHAVTSTPVKIVQLDNVTINDLKMYVLWGMIELDNSEFEVPIRFYALPEDYDSSRFDWVEEVPTRMIDLSNYVSHLEDQEDAKWASILDG